MSDEIPEIKPGAEWLFVSDVDDTLLGHDAALCELVQALDRAGDRLIVAYNSSRPCASVRRTIATNPDLPLPDYLIGALGTEIQVGRSAELLPAYSRRLDDQWDRPRLVELAAELGLSPHPAEFQTPFKASYDVPGPDAHARLLRRLEQEALEAKVIFSGGKNLDLIPIRAGKGQAVRFLRSYLAIDPACVVVAGDSGNDLEMFAAPHKGIIVANADEDLKRQRAAHIYHAAAAHAGGVLEGLHYWGVLA